MKKTLAIIVLTWNDFNNTKNCIRSIYPQLNKNIKLILVDNNSDENIYKKTNNWIKKNYQKNFLKKNSNSKIKLNYQKKIILIRNKKNYGCGLGHNYGYKFALKNNFEFIARIDNDMVVKKNFFKNLLIHFQNTKVHGVSPKIMYKFSPNKIWWMGTKIGNSLKWQKHMRDYPYGISDNSKFKGVIITDAIAGCASLMRASRLKKVGLSDPEFFYGPEDVELSRRIFTQPGSLIVDRNIKIYHAVTQSFVNFSVRRIYYEYKYRLLLIKKIGNFYDKFFGYSVSILKFLLYLIFSFQEKHRRKIIPVLFAIIHFFQNKLGKFDRSSKAYFK